MDSCSGAGMTVGASSCPRSLSSWKRGRGYPEGGMGRGLPRAPGMDSCFEGRNDGGTSGGNGAGPPTCPSGWIPPSAGNVGGRGGYPDIAPHDHPWESRGPLRSRAFDMLRANGGIGPARGEPVEPCERLTTAVSVGAVREPPLHRIARSWPLRQAQGERGDMARSG